MGQDTSVVTYLYFAKLTCLFSHRTALVSIADATASPQSTALSMRKYPSSFGWK